MIIGGGFGGLTAAQSLGTAPVQVTVVDRENHHLFQPLLYQVAMAGLSPAEIASPIRSILSRQENTRVLLGNVTAIDLESRTVKLTDDELVYDFLIVASGVQTSYFGHDEWEKDAPGLKSLEDAIEIRRRVLTAFERAEREKVPERQKRLLTFVAIGGGPTGVELAGSVAELARFVLSSDFRAIDPQTTRVVLIEAGDRILPSFDPRLSQSAVDQLQELGVEVRTRTRVTGIDADGVDMAIDGADATQPKTNERIETNTVVWAAGVRTTALTKSLGVPLDRMGRVLVEPDLSVTGHSEAFVIGDAAAFLHQTGKALPGVSAVAMQQARAAARSIRVTIRGKPRIPFRYFDKGSMATIGRSRAISEMGKLRFTGFFAWLTWLLVHIWYLIGFRNRMAVMFTWAWSYVTYRRGARLITHRRG